MAYAQFEQKTTDNLHQIIKETHRIIEENSIQLGAYTKIDWINVYFENAKNTSDTYMQNVWAKVLAKELAFPGSFSFKTLDILRGLSTDEFKLFEKLVSLSLNNYIFDNAQLKKHITWLKCLQMEELGLLNLNPSEHTITIPSQDCRKLLLGNNVFALFLNNKKESEEKVKSNVYVLTSSAEELKVIIEPTNQNEYFVEIAKILKEKWKPQVNVTLHKVNWVVGTNFSYDETDLIAD